MKVVEQKNEMKMKEIGVGGKYNYVLAYKDSLICYGGE
jgi:hypothetical protein